MRLIGEARVRDLLPAGSPGRLEASGVVLVEGRYLVIFDNLRAVARIDADLPRIDAALPRIDADHPRVAANDLVWMPPAGSSPGYEDIAHDPATGHLFLLIESERRDGGYQARVE